MLVSQQRWLNDEELELWLKLVGLSMLMPSAVETQLKRDAGINLFEYHVLAMLSEADQHSRLMTDLAFHTNSTLSRLSHVVTRLEGQGWVKRAACETDGRATNVMLTDAGWEKVKSTAPGHVAAVRDLIFDPLNQKQVKQLNEALQPILESVDTEQRRPKPARTRG